MQCFVFKLGHAQVVGASSQLGECGDAVRHECFAMSVEQARHIRQVISLAPPLCAVFIPAAHVAVFYGNWLGWAFKLVDHGLLQILFHVSDLCGYFGEPNGDFALFGRAGDDVNELGLGALQLGELFGI